MNTSTYNDRFLFFIDSKELYVSLLNYLDDLWQNVLNELLWWKVYSFKSRVAQERPYVSQTKIYKIYKKKLIIGAN